MPKANEAAHDEQSLRALGANLPINSDLWQNVESSEDIIDAFYLSGNFYAGIHMKELVKVTGLPKHAIYYRLTQWQKRDREAGKLVPKSPSGIRFNAGQRQILLEAFHENRYPSSQKKVRLSSLTGLTKEQVQQWFTTKRQDDRRREQRLALQNGAEALGVERNGNNQN